MLNLLDKYRIKNPRFNTVDDETVLKTIHQQSYSNIDYDTYKNKVLNTEATFGLSEQPDITKEPEVQKELKNSFVNISPKRIREIQGMKPMGSFEAMRKLVSWGVDDDKSEIVGIIKKSDKDVLNEEERQKLKDYFDFQAQVQLRGVSRGGKILSGIGNSGSYIAQSSAVRYGLGAIGAGVGGAIAGPAGFVAGYRAVINPITEPIIQTALMPNQIEANKIDREYQSMITITDKGQVLLKRLNQIEEDAIKQKAISSTYIENLNESIWDAVFPVIGGFVGKAASKSKSQFLKKATETSTKFLGSKFMKGIEGTTVSSIPTEMFEELATDVMNTVAGNQEGRWNDTFKKSPEEWFELFGIVAGAGTISRAAYYGASKLKANGASPSDISAFLNMPETQKDEVVKRLYEAETEAEIQGYNQYLDNVKNKLVESGQTPEQAEASTKLFDLTTTYATSNYSDLSRVDFVKQNLGGVELGKTPTKTEQLLNDKILFQSEVLYKDDYGKNIVFDDNNALISIDDPQDTRFVALFDKKKDKKIGQINTEVYKKDWIALDIKIDNSYRGKGYGSKMIESLLNNISNQYKGIVIIGENRINNKEIPAIAKKLNMVEKDGDFYIEKPKEVLNQGIKGQFDTKTKIISLFENSDITTFQHETMHWFRGVVDNAVKSGSKQAQSDLDVMNKFVGARTNNWTTKQEEKFARSYEQYLRKGIAPTEDLRTVFEKISDWFKEVYKTASELNVSLTPEITQFYDRIFSQEQRQSPEATQLMQEIEQEKQVLYQQGLSDEEVNKSIQEKYGERLSKIKMELTKGVETKEEDYTSNAAMQLSNNSTSNILSNTISDFGKSVKTIATDIFTNADSILKNEYPEVWGKVMKTQADIDIITANYFKKLEPWYKKTLAMKKKNIEDYYTLDLALKNRDVNKIQQLTDKYDLYNDYLEARQILDDLRDKALSVGIEVGYLENYFPRQIQQAKLNDFLLLLRQNESGLYNDLIYNISLLEKENKIFTDEDRLKLINSFLNGYIPKMMAGSVTANLKKPRELAVLTPLYNSFYEESNQALEHYISSVSKTIILREAIGKEDIETNKLRASLKRKNKALVEAKNNNNFDKIKSLKLEIEEINSELPEESTLEKSIGKYVSSIENLDIEKQKQLRELLTYIFNPVSTGRLNKILTNTSYGLALNSIKNAINQLPELANSMYKNGFLNTINSVVGNKLTIKDLWINTKDMFQDSFQLVDAIMKYTGFNALDTFSKNVFINANLKNIQQLIKSNDKGVNERLRLIFDTKAEQVKEDILNNNLTTDVRSALLINLAEVQPLFKSSRPLQFLKNPSTRFMYSLKTFTLKQLDVIKNDIIKNFKTNPSLAFKNLIIYQSYLMLIGFPIDFIQGLFAGEEPDDPELIKNSVLDNIILLNLIGRYTISKGKQVGYGKAGLDYLISLPIVGAFDDITKDIGKIIDGEFNIEKSRSIKYIPFGKDIKNLIKED